MTLAPPGPVAATVMAPGTVMTGGVSSTRTVKECETGVSASLSAVQMTVVIPTWKVDPDGWLQVTVPVRAPVGSLANAL